MTFPTPDIVIEREYLMQVRKAHLIIVDAIEKKLNMPRTSELRAEVRRLRNEQSGDSIPGKHPVSS